MMRFKRSPFRTPSITRPGDGPAYPYLLLPLILLWLASSWYAYDYGRERAGFDSDRAEQRLTELRAEMKVFKRERDQLKRQLVNLESENKVFRVVQAELQASIRQEQDERLALEKKHLFLRGVEKGELERAVLELRELKTWQEQPGSDYRLSFTLTQAMHKQPQVQGQIRLSLIGTDAEGKEQALPFGRIAQEKWSGRMNFKHFQRIETRYRLPEGFVPSEWWVEIQPEDDRVVSYRDRFAWRLVE